MVRGSHIPRPKGGAHVGFKGAGDSVFRSASSADISKGFAGEGGGCFGCLLHVMLALVVAVALIVAVAGCSRGSTNPEYKPPPGQEHSISYIMPQDQITYFPASTLKLGIWYVYVKDPENPGTCKWNVTRLNGGPAAGGTATNKLEHDQFAVSAGDNNVSLTPGCDHARQGG